MHRYTVSSSAGQRDGNRYAVLDHHYRQGGKGIRRVSFHATHAEAQREAKRLNRIHEDLEEGISHMPGAPAGLRTSGGLKDPHSWPY